MDSTIQVVGVNAFVLVCTPDFLFAVFFFFNLHCCVLNNVILIQSRRSSVRVAEQEVAAAVWEVTEACEADEAIADCPWAADECCRRAKQESACTLHESRSDDQCMAEIR